jgi:sugar O-acyltransferase (sialic acid O-acetyltransferase NeuD family)
MTKQKLIIIGAGKFAREVCTWAGQAAKAGAPWSVAGFLDKRQDALDGFDYGLPILSSPEAYVPEGADVFLCAIGDPGVKKQVCCAMVKRGARFATLVHPTAVVGHNVEIGAGSIVGPLTQLSCDIRLGEHVAFGTHSNTAHDTRIGDYCQISGSCEINGNAVLDEGVFLGSHATVLPNAHVGAWAFVGAGSVVLRNVKTGSRVFGNPAVTIGHG